MGAYHNPAHWPTSDGVIPYRLFFALLGEADVLEARKRLETAIAIAHGAGLAMNGKDPRVKSETRAMIRRAHPRTHG